MNRILLAGTVALVATSSLVAWTFFNEEAAVENGASSVAVDVAAPASAPMQGGVVQDLPKAPKPKLPAELLFVESDHALGNPDAPVQMVEYVSMTCGHCANFGNNVFPDIKRDYIDTGKLKFTLRQMPWDPVSMAITKLANCTGSTDGYYSMVKAFFQTQNHWIHAEQNMLAEIKKIARIGGFDEASFNACLKDEALQQRLYMVMKGAKDELNVNATPSFFINGERISGAVSYAAIKRVIDAHLAEAE